MLVVSVDRIRHSILTAPWGKGTIKADGLSTSEIVLFQTYKVTYEKPEFASMQRQIFFYKIMFDHKCIQTYKHIMQYKVLCITPLVQSIGQ